MTEKKTITRRDFLKNTLNLDITNLNEEILYYFFTYSVSTMYFRTLSQYLDFFVQQCCREYWKNGGYSRMEPPSPRSGDGYYYYTDHMDKIQVPLICFLADGEGEILDFVDCISLFAFTLFLITFNLYCLQKYINYLS